MNNKKKDCNVENLDRNNKDINIYKIHPLEILNYIWIIIIFLILIIMIMIKPNANELLASSMSFGSLYFGIPIYIIITFPKLFSWIFISYLLGNIIISSKYIKKIISIKYEKMIISLWFTLSIFLILLIFQLCVKKFFLIPSQMLLSYLEHSGLFIGFDVIFGLFLGLLHGITIQIFKSKHLK